MLAPGSDCRWTCSADVVCISRLSCLNILKRNMPAYCTACGYRNRYVPESSVKLLLSEIPTFCYYGIWIVCSLICSPLPADITLPKISCFTALFHLCQLCVNTGKFCVDCWTIWWYCIQDGLIFTRFGCNKVNPFVMTDCFTAERGICPIATLYILAAAYKEGRCKQGTIIFHGGHVVVNLSLIHISEPTRPY